MVPYLDIPTLQLGPLSIQPFGFLVCLGIIVGWFVPLLGIPLLAFLIVDALIGRRSPTDQPHNRYRPRARRQQASLCGTIAARAV
mgnify:CR=1 FL=1